MEKLLSQLEKGLAVFFKWLFYLATVALLLYPQYSYSNPQGGQVVAGNATITTPAPNTVQVTQSTDKAIINWQSYNVASQEHVNYQQPSQSSISLNRIDPRSGVSQVYGRITANGQVWLVNPAGVWFGPSARVDVAGLVATTASISNEDFLAGRYSFQQIPGWNGVVTNEGLIKIAEAGLVALVGQGVVNNGHIEASMGTVILASGSAFTIQFTGNQLVSFVIDQAVAAPAAVTNTGSVVANGGKIMVSARTASDILDHTINMAGVAQTNSIREQNGEIILDAGNGKVEISGKILASGKEKNETGGKVTITGGLIILTESALVDVSGDAGGGVALIGGGAHGIGLERNANYLWVDRGAILNANALSVGNGGTVVLWSERGTGFYGEIYARGGSQRGNGGWVETSGGSLDYSGTVDTVAVNGKLGQLLLDPKFLEVKTSGGSAYSAGVNNLFANNTSGTNIITPASIDAANANITLQANTDVTFTDDLSMTNSGRTLTVQAGRSILINSNITTTNGAITMTANDSSATGADRDAGDGSITMATGTTINSGTAAMVFTVGSSTTSPFSPGDISLVNLTKTGASTVTMTSPNAVTISGAANAGSGAVTINTNTSGSASKDFNIASGGSVTTTNTGVSAVVINVNAAGGGTGAATLGGNITTGSGGRITIATNTGGNTTGGSITQTAGTLSVVGTGSFVLSVPTASASTIGTSAVAPLSTTSAGGTLTLTMGSGGAFVTNTGSLTLGTPTVTATDYPLSIISSGTLTLPAASISTGTGDLTLRSNGGTLATVATRTLTTGSGNLTLVGSTGLTLNSALTTGSGLIALSTTTSGGITQAAAGTITSTSGDLTMTARDAVSLAAAINTGSGTVTINANGDGAGAQTFSMGAGSSITTTNTSSGAVAINVNTASGGTGTAALRSITTGAGGTISVATNTGGNTTGGSITQTAATALDVGAAGTITLAVPTASASSIGLVGTNILTTSAGGTLNLTLGTGGAFVTNTGSVTLATPTVGATYPFSVISTGTLTLPAFNFAGGGNNALTLRSNGGTLATNGSLTTSGSGALTLVGSTGLTIAHAVTSGTGTISLSTTTSGDLILTSAGSISSTSGSLTLSARDNVDLSSTVSTGNNTIAISANQDGAGSEAFTMNAGSSVTTTNTSATAIVATVNTTTGGSGAAQLTSMTSGNGGTITVTTVPGANTTGEAVTQLSGGILDANPTGATTAGTVILRSATGNTSSLGASSDHIQTRAGTLTLVTGSGGAFINNIANGSGYTGSTTLSTLSLSANSPLTITAAGTLTLSAATIATGTSDITLTGGTGITSSSAMSTTTGDIILSTTTSGGITQNAAGTITSTSGDLTMTARDAVSLAAAIDMGSGMISINTNSDGAGAQTFSMGAGSSITTTNTSASAVAINVNSASGGTGTASLRGITTGSGGSVVVRTDTGGNVTGGDITRAAGTIDVGTGTVTLMNPQIAGNNIGTAGTPIQIVAGTLNATTGASGVFITNTGSGSLDLGTISSTGAFTLTSTSSSGITDTGLITVTGTTTLVAGASQDVVLNNASNDFATVAITSANNVTLFDANGLNLGASTVSGNLTLTLGGALSDSGTVIVSGASGLTAITVGGAVLNSAANQIAVLDIANSGSGNITIVSVVPLTVMGFSQSGGGTTSFTDTGMLSVADGVTINSSNAALTITATDLNLNTTGALNSGSADITITQNTAGGSIGLGNTAGTMTISGAELQNMTATNLNLTAPSNGQVIVDGVTVANSANISGTTTLTATTGTLGNIVFQTADSSFGTLTANADDGIAVSAGVTATVGNMILNADVNGGAATDDALTISGNLTAAGSITLSAATGGIILGAPVSLTANGIAINHSVNGSFNLTVDSGASATNFAAAVGNVTPIGSGIGVAIALNSTGATAFSSTVATNAGISAVGAVTFNNAVTLGDGNVGSIFSGLVTLSNATGYTFSGFDGVAFNAGLTTSGGSMTVNSNNSVLSMSNLTLGSTVSLLSGSGETNVTGSVSGAGETLILQDNTAASTGTVTIGGNVTLGNLTTFAEPYSVVLQGATNTISAGANDVAFNVTITAAGRLHVTANRLTGNIDVDRLTINLSTGNFFGMVANKSGVPAIRTFTVLNVLAPGRIFFDGYDIYLVFSPSPTPASILFPTNYAQWSPMASEMSALGDTFAQSVLGDCVTIAPSIKMCGHWS